MSDIETVLSTLRRPSLLMRAARSGVTNYRRSRELPALTGSTGQVSPQRALDALVTRENALETVRQAGLATYSVQMHVRILTAVIAEARALRLA